MHSAVCACSVTHRAHALRLRLRRTGQKPQKAKAPPLPRHTPQSAMPPPAFAAPRRCRPPSSSPSPALLLLLLTTDGLSAASLSSSAAAPAPDHYDIVVYGSSGAACVAAIAAARSGATSVALLSQTAHIGGMLTGGLQHTDSANDTVVQARPFAAEPRRERCLARFRWEGRLRVTLLPNQWESVRCTRHARSLGC